MANLSELIAQKEALDRQIDQVRTQARTEAISRVRELMSSHGLTLADVSVQRVKASTRVGSTVAPKYRDPMTGATWTGRGLKPKWLSAQLAEGKSLEDFRI
jgi:DNA-binding protein H-NS